MSLPSTQIGSGMMGPIGGSSSMSGSADLIPLFIAPLIGMGQGLTAPTPYQQKYPFGNLSTDIANGLSSELSKVLPAFEAKAGQDVSLPDAVVGDLPSFYGGGLPMPIGVPSLDASGHGGLRTPYVAPGLKIPTSGSIIPPNDANLGHRPGPSTDPSIPATGTAVPADPNRPKHPNVGPPTAPDGGAVPRGGGATKQSFLNPRLTSATGDILSPGTGGAGDSASLMDDSASPTMDPTMAALSLLRHVASSGATA